MIYIRNPLDEMNRMVAVLSNSDDRLRRKSVLKLGIFKVNLFGNVIYLWNRLVELNAMVAVPSNSDDRSRSYSVLKFQLGERLRVWG